MPWHGRVSKQCERSRFTNQKVDTIGRGQERGIEGAEGGGGVRGGRARAREGPEVHTEEGGIEAASAGSL